nr:hypothetical protein [uncultured Methanospirillum sp.]
MNFKVLCYSLVFIISLVCIGFVTASNTSDSAQTNAVIKSNIKAAVTSITPDTGKPGEHVIFILNGTELSKNIKVYLENGDLKDPKSIIANAVNVTSSTSLTGSFNIPNTSSTGAWNVTVKEAGEIFPSGVTFTITR